MRFGRNTSLASLRSAQAATLRAGTLGDEWDIDADNGFRLAGPIPLSTATLTVPTCILGYTTTGTCPATQHLPAEPLVFSAGTEPWSWGLDANNGASGTPTDPTMQQATATLLAGRGA
jgi:hypothetical protein